VRSSGVSCDVCNKFVTTVNDTTLPDEWIKVVLPHSISVPTAQAQKDLCSNKCLMTLGRERMKATGEDNTTKKKSSIDPKLREFLLKKGLRPAQLGATMRSHVSYQHETTRPRPECLICDYLVGTQAIAGWDRDTD